MTSVASLAPEEAAASDLNAGRLARQEVRALRRYHLDLSPCRHKLDQNEVPYDLPPPQKRRAVERIAARAWERYPDFHADGLRRRLAERHGVPFDAVLVGNGSNELLATTLEAVAGPGVEVLVPVPTFGLYRVFAVRAGSSVREVPSGEDLRLPLTALDAEIERDPTRPVILCTPNNPTGDAATVESVERLLERLEAPLLLDNAYAEFCDLDYRPLLARFDHLMIFRTFSKAWSLGGARLGYLLAAPSLVAELVKVKLPYNVGFPSALLGEEVLDRPAAAERRLRAILGRRPQWRAMLERFGFTVFPSQANFWLARAPHGVEIDAVRAGLEARGIRVRDVSGGRGLSGCMRVSVGSGRALRDVEAALREILPGASEEATP
ncbi:MAG: histidinol-phosphate transaminase [Acidobacteriota bacterium]